MALIEKIRKIPYVKENDPNNFIKLPNEIRNSKQTKSRGSVYATQETGPNDTIQKTLITIYKLCGN